MPLQMTDKDRALEAWFARVARWVGKWFSLPSLLATGAFLYLYERGRIDSGARAVLDGTLPSPSSTKYLSTAVLSEHGDQRVVYVVLDTANAYGALLRKHVCVAYETDGRRVRWDREAAVQECPDRPDASGVAAIRRLQGWKP